MSQKDTLKKNILEMVTSQLNCFDKGSELSIKEVGDGNVNYIFRVEDEKGKSIIVKFADSFIRGSSTRELSTKRNEIENKILRKQGELSNHAVPEIYLYSKEMSCIVMEDMKDYVVLREGMMEGKTYPHFAKDIAQFLYDTLFKTTDLVMDIPEKKTMAGNLVNIDMCEISERLVFTEPYLNRQGLNRYNAKNEKFVVENLYNNDSLKFEVATLKNRFMNQTQSMIHGDLHAGSIFINDEDLKVFDPEFSFFGPMGYDIGNVVGSFIISYVATLYQNNLVETPYTKWLLESIKEVITEFKAIYEASYDNDVATPMFKDNALFKDAYLKQILADTAGYAGTEMIRRTVGVAKVWDLDKVQDNENIDKIERCIVNIGMTLILNRDAMQSAADYETVINKFIEEI
ncbi:S-methyl-5-thioribose kinase [Erysipelothrix inopinata]|uniref:S-methyl-5-thioribose kinase n=1 Tax=Erysipelothrix inopinata TaxID=225084 RepID=A0A7G9RZF1_9FIRM|nr:S-methyl-5-thioribose kinase [Erysipelothrix inopinata]QNN60976.1 S-methyl-5-thioribose kinase [Erysipelothrix inopinata]